MQITKVRVIVTCPGRNYVIVKIETDEGVTGLGDATLNGRELAVATLLEEHLSPLLIGRNPLDIEDVCQSLYRGSYWRGGPVQMTAISGIDCALWDIKGKVAGLPLYALIGGRSRKRVLCYTHCGGDSPEQVVENVQRAREEGFRAIRCQISIAQGAGTYGAGGGKEAALASWGESDLPMVEVFDPSTYLRLVPRMFAAVRSVVGEDVELLHDVHQRLSPTEAARLARSLDEFGLFFLEDPIRPEQTEHLSAIRRHSTTPIATSELFNSTYDLVRLLSRRLIDYARFDLAHCGAVTAALKIAHLGEPFDIKTAWHGPGDISPVMHAANVHVDTAIWNFGIQEMVMFPSVVSEVFHGGPDYSDGYLSISDTPGLGVEIDENAAAKYPYRRKYLPVVRKPDGTAFDW